MGYWAITGHVTMSLDPPPASWVSYPRLIVQKTSSSQIQCGQGSCRPPTLGSQCLSWQSPLAQVTASLSFWVRYWEGGLLSHSLDVSSCPSPLPPSAGICVGLSPALGSLNTCATLILPSAQAPQAARLTALPEPRQSRPPSPQDGCPVPAGTPSSPGSGRHAGHPPVRDPGQQAVKKRFSRRGSFCLGLPLPVAAPEDKQASLPGRKGGGAANNTAPACAHPAPQPAGIGLMCAKTASKGSLPAGSSACGAELGAGRQVQQALGAGRCPQPRLVLQSCRAAARPSPCLADASCLGRDEGKSRAVSGPGTAGCRLPGQDHPKGNRGCFSGTARRW